MRKTERIIIIDDNLDHLKRASDYLAGEGFSVTTEQSSNKALDRLSSESFDLVLIKHNLPSHDAISIMKQLQKEGSKSSFIIMAEYLDIKQTIRIMEEGAYSILMIPYELNELKEVVSKGLQNNITYLSILQLSENLAQTNKELKKKQECLENEQKLLETKIEELNFLNKISSLMSSSLNPEIIIDKVVENLKSTIDFDIFSVMMLDDKEIFLKIHSNDSLETGLLEDINRNIHKSFTRYLGKETSVDQPQERRVSKVVNIFPGSELDFNLEVAGKKLGVLKIIRFSGKPFTSDQKNLLSTLANQLSLSLNNSLKHKKYLGLASHDFLTNTLNRRTFDEVIDREFARSVRYKTPLSVMMMDLDYFKKINDEWGHQSGDLALKQVSEIVSQCLRESDVLARYGGEEFVVILPQTDIEKAGKLGERIRHAIESNPINVQEGQIKVTASFGISSYPFTPMEDKNELVKLADSALYQAKKNGRNRVSIHSYSNKISEINCTDKSLQQKKEPHLPLAVGH